MEDKPQYLTKPVEIKIPQVSYNNFKITTDIPDAIILHEHYLEFKTNYRFIHTEDSIEKPEQKYQSNITLLKKSISEIFVSWNGNKEIYEIEINKTDHNNVITLFKTFSEALEVKNKILQWLIQ